MTGQEGLNLAPAIFKPPQDLFSLDLLLAHHQTNYWRKLKKYLPQRRKVRKVTK